MSSESDARNNAEGFDPAIGNDNEDAELLGFLNRALMTLPAEVDPMEEPPPSLMEGAQWAHDWVTMESDLAELTFDSETDLALSGIRAADSNSLRELTFVKDEYTIELELTLGARTAVVSGVVSPELPGTLQMMVGGEVFDGPIDAGGRFEIRDLPRGTVLALLDIPGEKIRLGSFEV